MRRGRGRGPIRGPGRDVRVVLAVAGDELSGESVQRRDELVDDTPPMGAQSGRALTRRPIDGRLDAGHAGGSGVGVRVRVDDVVDISAPVRDEPRDERHRGFQLGEVGEVRVPRPVGQNPGDDRLVRLEKRDTGRVHLTRVVRSAQRVDQRTRQTQHGDQQRVVSRPGQRQRRNRRIRQPRTLPRPPLSSVRPASVSFVFRIWIRVLVPTTVG